MDNIQYKRLLNKCPDPSSKDFITFLLKNNTVVMDNHGWIIIENCKYHKSEDEHFTAYCKEYYETVGDMDEETKLDMLDIFDKFNDWFIYRNSDKNLSIKRYHFHIRKSNPTKENFSFIMSE